MQRNALPVAKDAVAVAMGAATIAKRVKPAVVTVASSPQPAASLNVSSPSASSVTGTQVPLFPPAQTPAQMGLLGADPDSTFYRQPYSAETLELEVPYLTKRCRWAIREIAEAWQALVELGAEVPSREARMYQRITERYAEFSADGASAGQPISASRVSEAPNERS